LFFGLGCNALTCLIATQDKLRVLTKCFQHNSCAHPGYRIKQIKM
jgi:hypothetical protein